MLTMDGAKHRQQRTVMSKAFTPGMVKKLEEKFRGYAVNIVDAALEKGTFNFVTDIGHTRCRWKPSATCWGCRRGDRAKFFAWVDTFAAPFDTRITPSFEYVLQAIFDLLGYAVELGELKRREPGEDVITQLVQAGAEVISEDELMGNVALLACGAAESTRTALSHGMHELMRNPAQMTWLRDHAHDIPNTAIQEIVRIATPFTHLVRTATADHELHGQHIKEGDVVLMLFAAGNFDERAFDEPQRLRLGPREESACQLRARPASVPGQARRGTRDEDPARRTAATHQRHHPCR